MTRMIDQNLKVALGASLLPDTLRCDCPSCGARAKFQYCGTQRWPLRVALAASLAPVLHLYTCDACGTTISYTEEEIA
jgi:hypothetical protein